MIKSLFTIKSLYICGHNNSPGVPQIYKGAKNREATAGRLPKLLGLFLQKNPTINKALFRFLDMSWY